VAAERLFGHGVAVRRHGLRDSTRGKRAIGRGRQESQNPPLDAVQLERPLETPRLVGPRRIGADVPPRRSRRCPQAVLACGGSPSTRSWPLSRHILPDAPQSNRKATRTSTHFLFILCRSSVPRKRQIVHFPAIESLGRGSCISQASHRPHVIQRVLAA